MVVIPKEELAQRLSVSLGAPRRGVVFGHLWEGFQDRTPERRNVVVVVVVVVAVFTINRSFYPTTSAPHPVSVLILYPREIKKNCDHRLRQKKKHSRDSIKAGKSKC